MHSSINQMMTHCSGSRSWVVEGLSAGALVLSLAPGAPGSESVASGDDDPWSGSEIACAWTVVSGNRTGTFSSLEICLQEKQRTHCYHKSYLLKKKRDSNKNNLALIFLDFTLSLSGSVDHAGRPSLMKGPYPLRTPDENIKESESDILQIQPIQLCS